MKQMRGGNEKIVTYARVPESRSHYPTVEEQQRLFAQHAADNGLEVVARFMDTKPNRPVSGRRTGRPGFRDLQRFLSENRGVRAILGTGTHSLFKSMEDLLAISALNVRICTLEDEPNGTTDGPSGLIIHGFRLMSATGCGGGFSARVRRGMTTQAMRGIWPARSPLGYRRNHGTGKLEHDEQAAPCVARAFALAATGEYSVAEIRDAVWGRGSGSDGGSVRVRRLRRLLKNPIYCGQLHWSGDVYRGSHLPIVSQAVFDRVQSHLAENGQSNPRGDSIG